MSNGVVRVLLFASGLLILSSPAFADPQADCTALDSAAAQNPGLGSAPGYCTQLNTTKAAQDQYQPPGACVDYEQLGSFTLGAPATLQNCGASASMPGGGSGGGAGSSGDGSSSSDTGQKGNTTAENPGGDPNLTNTITGTKSPDQTNNEDSTKGSPEEGSSEQGMQ